MNRAAIEKGRKRVNFMVDGELLDELDNLIPSGERSNFINEALYEAVKQLSRQKAAQEIKEIAAKGGLNITVKEFLKLRHHGLS